MQKAPLDSHVELKAAFNLIDRSRLWLLHRSFGLLERIVGLMHELYTDTVKCPCERNSFQLVWDQKRSQARLLDSIIILPASSELGPWKTSTQELSRCHSWWWRVCWPGFRRRCYPVSRYDGNSHTLFWCHETGSVPVLSGFQLG